MTDKDHYKTILTCIGIVKVLHVHTPEELTSDLTTIQDILLECVQIAKSYSGNNPQILEGYRDILVSIPTLLDYCPQLYKLI
jgi:hypothetical protein